MYRVLEVVGLLAPVGGIVILSIYRSRSRTAFGLGIPACLFGTASSCIGFFGTRVSIISAYESNEGVSGVMERLEVWSVIRITLLIIAGVLLVFASVVERTGDSPVGWITGGLILMALGVTLQFVSPDIAIDHPRLSLVVGMLTASLKSAALGAGFLALCIAAVAHRPGHDGRRDPAKLASSVVAFMSQVYKKQ